MDTRDTTASSEYRSAEFMCRQGHREVECRNMAGGICTLRRGIAIQPGAWLRLGGSFLSLSHLAPAENIDPAPRQLHCDTEHFAPNAY